MTTADELIARANRIGWFSATNDKGDTLSSEELVAEIKRLSANQLKPGETAFRWNDGPWGCATSHNLIWKLADGSFTLDWKKANSGFYHRWAVIPPLPEPPAKTQEQLDEEAFRSWYCEQGGVVHNHDAFLAGLAAARKQQ